MSVWEMVHAKIGAGSIINHFQLGKFLLELFSNLHKNHCLGKTVGKLGVDVTVLNLLPASIGVTAEKKRSSWLKEFCEFVNISSAQNILTAQSLQFTRAVRVTHRLHNTISKRESLSARTFVLL